MRFSLYNVIASQDEATIVAKLSEDRFVLRRLDGANVRSAREYWDASAKHLRHRIANGWDGYAEYLAEAVLPNDEEGNKIAFLWVHADLLISSDLRAFLSAFDVLITLGRAAYARGTEMLIFLLGDGAAFPPMTDEESR
ncbi:MAG TPA: hypothetical protein VFP84_34655 [Kofleriaceae bacterium]|nr:hypothetical protein [Kofleriaceae bacterium]